ncbi:hypothetical protein MMC14_006528 [Varicellaria rhodocarpa]|nr:hypothetical protein [Varicellaria rhodocarpa]
MPTIIPGQQFDTLADFKNALHQWAIEKNFTPAILDSDTHRVRAGCRSSPDCPFRIRANYLEKNGFAKVTTVDDVHTCVSSSGQLASQDIKRAETCKLKFLTEVVPKLLRVTEDTSTRAIIDVVQRTYGQKIALRQAQKVKAILAPKSKGPCTHCGKPNHKNGRCPLLRTSTLPTESAQSGAQHMDLDDRDDRVVQDDFNEDDNPPNLDVQTENFLRPVNTNRTTHMLVPTQNPVSHVVDNNANRIGLNGSSADLNMRNSSQLMGTNEQQQLVPSQNSTPNTSLNQTALSRLPPPRTNPNPVAGVNPSVVQPTNRTPQETRMEAAKMMQQAARLMQEAAKLSAEAARLIASTANA